MTGRDDMNVYVDVLDVCRCGHRAYMHVASQGVRLGCVAVEDGKKCRCTKFRPAKEDS